MQKKVYKHFDILIVLIAFIALIVSAVFHWDDINSYRAYNTDTRHYYRAVVDSIDREQLELDEMDGARYLGEQELTVTLLEGAFSGRQITVINYLTRVHNIHASVGEKLIVTADTPENTEPYYGIYNYDRDIPIGTLIAVFALVMLAVGRKKGFRALLGVGFTMTFILFFSVPAVYHGFSSTLVSVVTIVVTTAVSLLLLNGCSRRSMAAFLSTVCGIIAVSVLFSIFTGLLRLSGYNLDTAEELFLVSQSTGLDISSLLMACVLISALGAIMDVAVSLTASLDELKTVQPMITRKELFISGMNIGKDMIGTMSNTLILAFAGSAMPTMLVLVSYGYSVRQFISSDFLSIELVQGLCATMGVILTVPITAGIFLLFQIKTPPLLMKQLR